MRIPFPPDIPPRAIVRLRGRRAEAETLGLIDTGASVVVLPRELAERLGYDLATAPTVQVHTANGLIRVPTLTLAEVALGEARVRDVEAVCHALDDDTLPVLIGLSFLRQFVVTLDFRRGFLILEEG